ncbi:unnamed protein product [marine sediment metagenome]|uniref:Uncharacterized protein n=1 Tax=marine sediment metagenome TaxID=412755 RepID=X0UZD6_9ZZZZ
MKLEYIDIKLTIEACKKAISEAENIIGINQLVLEKMEAELKTGKYPKPKLEPKAPPAGTG